MYTSLNQRLHLMPDAPIGGILKRPEFDPGKLLAKCTVPRSAGSAISEKELYQGLGEMLTFLVHTDPKDLDSGDTSAGAKLLKIRGEFYQVYSHVHELNNPALDVLYAACLGRVLKLPDVAEYPKLIQDVPKIVGGLPDSLRTPVDGCQQIEASYIVNGCVNLARILKGTRLLSDHCKERCISNLLATSFSCCENILDALAVTPVQTVRKYADYLSRFYEMSKSRYLLGRVGELLLKLSENVLSRSGEAEPKDFSATALAVSRAIRSRMFVAGDLARACTICYELAKKLDGLKGKEVINSQQLSNTALALSRVIEFGGLDQAVLKQVCSTSLSLASKLGRLKPEEIVLPAHDLSTTSKALCFCINTGALEGAALTRAAKLCLGLARRILELEPDKVIFPNVSNCIDGLSAAIRTGKLGNDSAEAAGLLHDLQGRLVLLAKARR